MTVEEIKKLIDEGEYGKAGHALFEMAQKPKKGGVQTDGGGDPDPDPDSGGNGPRPKP